jgi:hypothetical protein
MERKTRSGKITAAPIPPTAGKVRMVKLSLLMLYFLRKHFSEERSKEKIGSSRSSRNK